MKKINWKVRINNKQFWLSLFPALLLLAQVVAAPFGYKLQLDAMNKQLLDIVNAVFMVLSILGIVTDHTTPGISDSQQVLDRKDGKKE
ncbi:phage holin [Enterococcus faecalis]